MGWEAVATHGHQKQQPQPHTSMCISCCCHDHEQLFLLPYCSPMSSSSGSTHEHAGGGDAWPGLADAEVAHRHVIAGGGGARKDGGLRWSKTRGTPAETSNPNPRWSGARAGDRRLTFVAWTITSSPSLTTRISWELAAAPSSVWKLLK